MRNHKLFKVNQNAVIENEQRGILILKKDNKWMLPGGRMEDEDATWFNGLLREIREETGLEEITVGDAIDVRLSDDGAKYVVTFWCIARGNPAITLSSEHDAYAWITSEELDNYPFWHPSIPERIRAASEF